MVCLDNFSTLFGVPEVEKGWETLAYRIKLKMNFNCTHMRLCAFIKQICGDAEKRVSL
jgi:hypothetical protein